MEQSELQAIWEQILQKVLEQRSLTELALNDWLRPVKPLSLSDTTLVLGAPTSLAREWIVKRYIPFLEDAVLDIAKKKLKIEIKNLNIEPALNSPPVQEMLLTEIETDTNPSPQEVSDVKNSRPVTKCSAKKRRRQPLL